MVTSIVTAETFGYTLTVLYKGVRDVTPVIYSEEMLAATMLDLIQSGKIVERINSFPCEEVDTSEITSWTGR